MITNVPGSEIPVTGTPVLVSSAADSSDSEEDDGLDSPPPILMAANVPSVVFSDEKEKVRIRSTTVAFPACALFIRELSFCLLRRSSSNYF